MKRHGLLVWGLALVVIGLLGLAVVEFAGSCFESRYGRRGRADRLYGDGSWGMMGPGGATGNGMMGPRGMTRYMMRDFSKSKYKSNGERIFLTGRSAKGTVDSNFGMMQVGCANCHGADGSGGVVFPDGAESADIRWAALSDEGMDAEDVKKAITEGIDEKGEPLSEWMPHWTMNKRDLDDVTAYLKTL